MDGAIQPDDYEMLFLRLSRGENPASIAEMELEDKAKVLSGSHNFFHWPLEFPDVFAGEEGGFDADVGNPPWDVLQPSTQEFYIQYDPQFRKYGKQEAVKRIKELHEHYPDMVVKWNAYEKSFQNAAAYAKEPAAFTALTAGKIDLYKAFLERFFICFAMAARWALLSPAASIRIRDVSHCEGCFLITAALIASTGLRTGGPRFSQPWMDVSSLSSSVRKKAG